MTLSNILMLVYICIVLQTFASKYLSGWDKWYVYIFGYMNIFVALCECKHWFKL